MLCLDLFLSFFDLREKPKHMPLIKDNIEMCELCSIAATGEFIFATKETILFVWKKKKKKQGSEDWIRIRGLSFTR